MATNVMIQASDEIQLENVTVKSAAIVSVSSAVEGLNLSIPELHVSTVSGDVEIWAK